MAEHLEDLAASFRRQIRAEGRSERTATIYGQAIRFHSAWLAQRGRPMTLDELTRAGIRAWLAELADLHEPSTVRTRYKGLRRFCRWLVAEGELDVDPMAGLQVPAVVDRRSRCSTTPTSRRKVRRPPAGAARPHVRWLPRR